MRRRSANGSLAFWFLGHFKILFWAMETFADRLSDRTAEQKNKTERGMGFGF